MNSSKKICSVILAITMLLGCFGIGVAVSAATPSAQTVKVEAGESVTLRFTEDPCYGIDGTITYSNRALFSSVTPAASPYGQVRENIFILSNAAKFDCEMNLTVKVSDSASVGETCTVTFTYLRVDNNQTLEGPEGLVKTVTVEVIEKAPSSSTTTTTTAPTTTTAAPTTTTAAPAATSTAAPTTTTAAPAATSTAAPTTTAKKVTTTTKASALDLTELNNQVTKAEALTSGDYTSESWAKVSDALTAAISARAAKKQSDVDSAANALKDAIAALVKLDSLSIQDLIDSVREYISSNETAKVLDALNQALAEAEAALQSGDQSQIDAAKTKLSETFADFQKAIADLEKTETVEVEVEKIVEVEPEGPWCNIRLHKLWLILLIISVLINIAFVALTVYYFINRKKEDPKSPANKGNGTDHDPRIIG